MNRFFIILLSFIFFIIGLPLLAQTNPVHYKFFNQENGISKNNVLQILPLANGNVAAVTEDAVFLLDGYSVEKWISSEFIGASLSYVSFFQKKIYVLTKNKGLFVLDSSGKKILSSIDLPKNFNANYFAINERFALFVISKVRLLILDLKDGKPLELEAIKKIRPNSVVYHNDKFYIGHESGLLYFNNGKINEIVVKFPCDFILPDADSLIFTSSEKLYSYKKDEINFLGQLKFPGKGGIFLPGGMREILLMTKDPQSRLWLVPAPGDELFLYHPRQCISIHASNNIPSSYITDLRSDISGNIWLGTFDLGALAIQYAPLHSLGIQINGKNIPPENIYFNGSELYIATSNGFYEFEIKNRILSAIIEPDPVFQNNTGKCVEYQDKLLIPVPSATGLRLNKNKSKSGKKIIPVPAKKIFSVKEELFIADMYESVIRWNPSTEKTADTLFSLPDFRIKINQLTKLKNEFFVLTNRGVYLDQNGVWMLLQGTQNLNCIDLFEYKNQMILIHQGGILKLNNDFSILPLLLKDGIQNAAMNNHKLYVCGSFGILELDSNFNVLNRYHRLHGLLSQTIKNILFSHSKIFITGVNGIQYNDIKYLKDKNTPLTIKKITVNDSMVIPSDKIYLKKNQNIKIHLLCPEFFFPELREFNYSINDEERRKTNQPLIVLNDLKGGSSEILIGADYATNLSLKINKERKFIETPLFWVSILAFIVIVSGASTWLLYGRIRKKIKLKLEEERKMNLLKHQAMNALLSPHFIFNSLTSIQHYINSNNPLKASEFLAKFSRLIRMIIERAADPEIPLNVELQRLKFYLDLEKERFSGKFDYEISADEELVEQNPSIPNMIVQPYAENAILHGLLPKGEGGKLNILFKKQDKFLKIIIEDNGIGLSESSKSDKRGHKSIATSTIKNILELNSRLKNSRQEVKMEELKNENGEVKGTRVTILLELT